MENLVKKDMHELVKLLVSRLALCQTESLALRLISRRSYRIVCV